MVFQLHSNQVSLLNQREGITPIQRKLKQCSQFKDHDLDVIPTFNFFQFKINSEMVDVMKRVTLQLIDISADIFYNELLQNLMALIASLNIRVTIRSQLEEVVTTIINGIQILNTSAKLLMFNVEGSLGLAQIQVGKFAKNPNVFCVRTALAEVSALFQMQAEAKNIQLMTHLLDFPETLRR